MYMRYICLLPQIFRKHITVNMMRMYWILFRKWFGNFRMGRFRKRAIGITVMPWNDLLRRFLIKSAVGVRCMVLR